MGSLVFRFAFVVFLMAAFLDQSGMRPWSRSCLFDLALICSISFVVAEILAVGQELRSEIKRLRKARLKGSA